MTLSSQQPLQQQYIAQLTKQLEYFTQYDDSQLITIAFDQTIFLESFQPLRFYLEQIKQNINRLAELDNIQVISYLAEKITAQFRVLVDALNQMQLAKQPTKINTNSANISNSDKYAVFQLPPEQRIHKYYEFLTRFNDQLAYLEQKQQQTSDLQQKTSYQQQILHYQQRRERCLAAIEQLEEYLTFKETLS
ncbi:primosomal replication protein PriC [Gallibacterium genomosp. 3]|uniref:Primosomal replication protein priB and priC n=1 Tax=Gallibacterium genomosp. 3 TaxID=505345 RepID=A0A1A7Q8E3_9PAST|nr:primosomal replication protein PriC [Gallibacterium genomosp. 3]OBX11143.1 primosomal replication protein priB and priC [Gallibacterium genomosp. 3]